MPKNMPTTLIELLNKRAQNQPDQIGYTFLKDGETEEINLTYAELEQRVRGIAAKLQNRAGERALLLYPTGLDYIAAFFGCMYAGVVAVPTYPPRRNSSDARLAAIATEAGATVVLTINEILSDMSTRLVHTPELKDLHWVATDNLPTEIGSTWQAPDIHSYTLAFLQYTSGSTSTPKGVMVSHGNVLHNLEDIKQRSEVTPKTVSVTWLPSFHDMGLIEGLLQPLYTGYRVIFMPPVSFLQKTLRWLETISRYQATHSGGPNFAYDLCARKITPQQRETLDLSHWHLAYSGAEPIQKKTLEQFVETFQPCGFQANFFYPCYGLAENTAGVSAGIVKKGPIYCTIEAKALEKGQIVEISPMVEEVKYLIGCGHCATDTICVIVDPNSLTRCQPDIVGEIWISGPCVAQGYWNRPDETEQTFQAYLADTGDGPFLRTGDLGFFKNGELFVTGRLKDIIIVRGRNYYPQDLELTVEKSHPTLNAGSCAAFSVEKEGEERLVVAQEVERTALRKLDVDEVVNAIRQAISEQHELQVYAVLLLKTTTIPKTSSGKIQRRACRAGFLDGTLKTVASRQQDISITPVSVKALQLLQQLKTATSLAEYRALLPMYLQEQVAVTFKLPTNQISNKKKLIQMGLDSLMAVELRNRIRLELDVDIPLVKFMEDVSVLDLARQIKAQLMEIHASNTLVPLTAATTPHDRQALSIGQKELWLLSQLAQEQKSSVYHTAFPMQIRSKVDVIRLQKAFQTLIERHPSLRTTFTTTPKGEPIQKVHESHTISFEHIDASNWNDDELNKRVVEAYQRPFDLEQGPLLRVNLFTRANTDHVLLLTIHHLVVDGWSLWILLDELGIQLDTEAKNVLPSIKWSYTDYVHWQAQMLESAKGEHLWNYWKQQLVGELPILNLHTDHPRLSTRTLKGASIDFYLDQALTQKLKQLAHTEKTTLYTVLIAVFKILLYRHTNQKDILVGSPVAGRSLAEFENIVGYFTNIVVLRTALSDELTFKTFLRQVYGTVKNALAHQDYPFQLLVDRLQPNVEPGRSAFYDVMFILQKPHRATGIIDKLLLNKTVKWGWLDVELFQMEQQLGEFDLTLEMMEGGGSLYAHLKYRTDLFEASTIVLIAENFHTLLKQVVDNPNRRISELITHVGK